MYLHVKILVSIIRPTKNVLNTAALLLRITTFKWLADKYNSIKREFCSGFYNILVLVHPPGCFSKVMSVGIVLTCFYICYLNHFVFKVMLFSVTYVLCIKSTELKILWAFLPFLEVSGSHTDTVTLEMSKFYPFKGHEFHVLCPFYSLSVHIIS